MEDRAALSDRRPAPIALQLRRLNHQAQHLADRVAREHGLTAQQWELLAGLRRAGGSLDQRELCCRFGVAPPTLTALIDSAERHGWVERLPHPGDRRRRRIALTARGAELAAQVPPPGREVARRLTAGFSAAEEEQLRALLARAARNLEGAR
jgi:DNA-binding MarR family transcriptional regulator